MYLTLKNKVTLVIQQRLRASPGRNMLLARLISEILGFTAIVIKFSFTIALPSYLYGGARVMFLFLIPRFCSLYFVRIIFKFHLFHIDWLRLWNVLVAIHRI